MRKFAMLTAICLVLLCCAVYAEGNDSPAFVEAIEATGNYAPYASGCQHTEYMIMGSFAEAQTVYTSVDGTYHRCSRMVHAVCMDHECGKKINIFFNPVTQQHHMVDNGYTHEEGALIHTVHQRCSMPGCGFTSHYDIVCDEQH